MTELKERVSGGEKFTPKEVEKEVQKIDPAFYFVDQAGTVADRIGDRLNKLQTRIDDEVSYKSQLRTSATLSWTALGEIVVFFGVLLVGFAYLWKRGDLAWVRSIQAERQAATQLPALEPEPEPARTALVGSEAAPAHH